MKLRVFDQKKDYGAGAAGRTAAAGSGRSLGAVRPGWQLRSLSPGQTLQGEVVSRNGNEVQIRLSDDTVMNARLDQNMNLELGKSMTFEVRGNGGTLTLSPLFANVATDPTTLKALEMASLPVDETTVSVTRLLMQAGLPIDRNSLQQVFREINAYPEANPADIVDLHRLGLAVTEENVAQIASYKNLTYQLTAGMDEVMGALPETLSGMVQAGDAEGAAVLYGELLRLVSGELSAMAGEEAGALPESLSEGSLPAGTVLGMAVPEGIPEGDWGILSGGEMSGTVIVTEEGTVFPGEGAASVQTGGEPAANSAAGQTGTAGQPGAAGRAEAMTQAVEAFGTAGAAEEEQVSGTRFFSENDRLHLFQELSDISVKYTGQTPPKDLPFAALLRYAGQLLQRASAEHNQGLMRSLLDNGTLKEAFQRGMERLTTLEPEEVGESGRVEELYQRLDRQLKGMAQALEEAGQSSGRAYQATANLTQNVDFLHQLNQIYAYVQLPLKLQDGNAHGDLYVYTNRRSLAAADGKVSALLHLDMEHLGPVDVYVALQNERVSTSFYVRDDDMLDFLMEHMDLLTERLKERGYDCRYSMQVRGEKPDADGGQPNGGVHALLEQEGHLLLSQYAFDVRA